MRRWPSRVPSRVPLAGRTGQRAECRLPQGQHRLPRPCGPPLKSGADRSRGVLSQGPPSTAGGQGHSGATWPPVSASNSTVVATSGMGGPDREARPAHRGRLRSSIPTSWGLPPRGADRHVCPRGWLGLDHHAFCSSAPCPDRTAPGLDPTICTQSPAALPRRPPSSRGPWPFPAAPACASLDVGSAPRAGPLRCARRALGTRHLPQHGRLASTPLAGQAQLRGSSSRGVSAALNHSPRPRGLLLPHPRREEFRLNDRHPALLPPKCPRPGPRPPPASASLLMERGQQPSPAEQVG